MFSAVRALSLYEQTKFELSKHNNLGIPKFNLESAAAKKTKTTKNKSNNNQLNEKQYNFHTKQNIIELVFAYCGGWVHSYPPPFLAKCFPSLQFIQFIETFRLCVDENITYMIAHPALYSNLASIFTGAGARARAHAILEIRFEWEEARNWHNFRNSKQQVEIPVLIYK